MGPKKDAKKGAAKEVNHAFYVRKADDLGEIPVDTSHIEHLVGTVANIETLFPEWDDSVEEKWHEPIAPGADVPIIYPKNLGVTGEIDFKTYFGLQTIEVAEDPKAKKGKDTKKGAVEEVPELKEIFMDEHGRPMPVVYKDSAESQPAKAEETVGAVEAGAEVAEDASSGVSTVPVEGFAQYIMHRQFRRSLTEEQQKAKLEQEVMQSRLAELNGLEEEAVSTGGLEPGSATTPEGENVLAQIETVKGALAASLSVYNPETDAPGGAEVDPFVCDAFRIVKQFVPSLVTAHLNALEVSTVERQAEVEEEQHILQETYLWRSIYPKLPSGKPCYNPAGKYYVRLYLSGKWRKVYVNDSIPVRADGTPAISCSEDKYELWPMLIAKALYTVYSACGYTVEGKVPDVMDHDVSIPPRFDEDGEEMDPDPSVYCRPQCIGLFTSFLLHLLTGWQPRVPVSVTHTLKYAPTKSAKLVKSFAAEGVCVVEEADIVRDHDEPDSVKRSASVKAGLTAGMDAQEAEFQALLQEGSRDSSDTDPEDDDDDEEEEEEGEEEDRDGCYSDRQDGSEDGVEGERDGGSTSGRRGTSSRPTSPLAARVEEMMVSELSNESEMQQLERTANGNSAPVIAPVDDGQVRHTKQRFKDEYRKRREYRDDVVSKVLERERKIAKITAALTCLLTEVFYLAIYDEASQMTRILPVLAVSYPSQNKNDLLQVQLLVHWRTSPAEATPFNPIPNPDDPNSADIVGVDEGPLPLTTPLEYEWLTIDDLVKSNAYLMGMDTKMLTPFETSWAHEWVPLNQLPDECISAEAEAEAMAAAEATKGKDKGKKGKADAGAEEAAPAVEYFADPGAMPVTLLKLDCRSFYTDSPELRPITPGEFSRTNTSSKISSPIRKDVRALMRQGSFAEKTAALQDAQSLKDEEDNIIKSPVQKNVEKISTPLADFLHFTVMLHADVVTEYKDEAEAEAAAEAVAAAAENPADSGSGGSAPVVKIADDVIDATAAKKAQEDAEAGVVVDDEVENAPKKRNFVPSDTILVLQEVRTDSLEPMMFVIEMKQTAYLPNVSRSFAISSKRLPQDPNQPVVFWMRLFSKASVHMHVCSEVGVSIGPAEKIWANMGKPVFVREGWSAPTRNATQQLVFRLPLVTEQANPEAAEVAAGTAADGAAGEVVRSTTSSAASSSAEDGVAAAAEEDDGFDAAGFAPGSESAFKKPKKKKRPLSPAEDADGINSAMTFLHVRDRAVDRYISVGTMLPDNNKPLAPFPRTQGNLVKLNDDPKSASVFLGRTYPAALFDRKASSVPAFRWKLIVLSEKPIKEPVKPINEEVVAQRFRGKFIANNMNALFRDIYSIEKVSFPLAFRLTTTHERPLTGSRASREREQQADNHTFKGLASKNARKALKQALTVKTRKKDLALKVNLYRASDMKLVNSYKGGEGVLCYSQSLDQFLPEGEEFDMAAAVAAAAEAKAAAAGGKKGDAKGGKGGKGAPAAGAGGTETVDVLVECVLDEEAMMISEDRLSRYPHVYDGLFPNTSDAVSHEMALQQAALAAGGGEGKKGASEAPPAAGDEIVNQGIQENAQVIEHQRQCLSVQPPSKVMIRWQIDMMSGKVHNVAHDTRLLEQEVAIKNTWEDESAGRAERSLAAQRYYKERREMEEARQKALNPPPLPAFDDIQSPLAAEFAAAMPEIVEESSPINAAAAGVGAGQEEQKSALAVPEMLVSPHHSAGASPDASMFDSSSASLGVAKEVALAPMELSDSMSESLVQALHHSDVEVLKHRYTTLLNIPPYEHKVDIIQKDPNDASKTSYIKPRDTSDVENEKRLQAELVSQRSAERAASESRVTHVAERFIELNKAMQEETKSRVQEVLTEATQDAVELARLWEAREAYRVYVQSQNASVHYLLQRAAEARKVALAAEEKAAAEAAALAEKLRKEEEKKAAKKKKS